LSRTSPPCELQLAKRRIDKMTVASDADYPILVDPRRRARLFRPLLAIGNQLWVTSVEGPAMRHPFDVPNEDDLQASLPALPRFDPRPNQE
jgi:hypothetical protein